MELSKELIKSLLDQAQSTKMKQLTLDDYDRWLMLNGAIKEIVEKTIRKEFEKPETIKDLIHRLVPINITQKVINKLANVYNEEPVRKAKNKNEKDQELLEKHVESMQLDMIQKENNKYFKLFKRNLQEIYVDENKKTALRNLPRHTYNVFTTSNISPNKPQIIQKIMVNNLDPEKQIHHWWSNENFWITNGAGVLLRKEMNKLDNEFGKNPYGTLPFTFLNEASYSVSPIADDDLMRMAIVFPLLLSDQAFAIKYLSWAVVYTVGSQGGDIPFSPSSIIHLPFGPNGEKPEIGTVKPEIDLDAVIRFVNMLMGLLLSTKNLSVGSVSTDLSVENYSSGVAKILDSAESREDKKDQQAYFRDGEMQLWNKLSKNMIPYWRENQMLADDLNEEFSSDFEVAIEFREPKIILSEKEQIELSSLRLKEGFSTLRRELASLNPSMDTPELDSLEQEILEYQQQKNAQMFPMTENKNSEDHYHEGTGPDIKQGEDHYHQMLDESGVTSTDPYGQGHTHIKPDGAETSGPKTEISN